MAEAPRDVARDLTADEALWSARAFERRVRERLDFTLPADLLEPGAPYGGDHRLEGRPYFTGVPRTGRGAGRHRGPCDGADRSLDDAPREPAPAFRTDRLSGGKIDATDASPAAAALREAQEEVGLAASAATLLGYLAPYLTGTGFLIVPLVAMLAPPLALTVNPFEVADAFEVPLTFLMDPGNHREHAREFAGRPRRFYAMPFEERYIWGATAGILRSLYERLL